jgi:drug/metabolite transporter (DMT)-like permease
MLLSISAWLGSWAWAFLTIGASAAQTARNVMQRHLVAVLGTAGATHVRFLFSLPFIAVLYVIETRIIGFHAPAMSLTSLLWLLGGAAAQAFATGLMLAGMKVRSFVVITAYTKTEPVIIAIFGALFLGETPSMAVAAAVRTLALLEVPMAQVVTRRMFRQGTSGREYLGMALIVGGIVLLING